MNAKRPLKIHPKDTPAIFGTTSYPTAELRHICQQRGKHKLGDIFGLTQFGVNLTHLAPGAASAQRHWHEKEDEFIFVVLGEITLITDEGDTLLRAGECAGFPANTANGHMLVNHTSAPASYIEIGSRSTIDTVHYPDIDLLLKKQGDHYTSFHKDGTPYDTDHIPRSPSDKTS